MINFIANQLKKPWGVFGFYLFNKLEKLNTPVYEATIKLLNISLGETILEIGFGTGKLLNMIANKYSDIEITGIDFSKLMYKLAKKLNKNNIYSNKIKLYHDNFMNLNLKDELFDKICGINIIYFFDKLIINKMFDILKCNGKLILYMNDPEQLNKFGLRFTKAFNKYEINEITNKMKETGFKNIQIKKYQSVNENGFFLIGFK
jgi:ubiquinone/menaquinone biosynthesis C-methylase UbiE